MSHSNPLPTLNITEYSLPPGSLTNPTAKMFYQNFEEHITRPYRLVIEGWPLGKLCCPSSLRTLAEVEILHQCWNTDATHFRRLSDEEWRVWLDGGGQQALSRQPCKLLRSPTVTRLTLNWFQCNLIYRTPLRAMYQLYNTPPWTKIPRRSPLDSLSWTKTPQCPLLTLLDRPQCRQRNPHLPSGPRQRRSPTSML